MTKNQLPNNSPFYSSCMMAYSLFSWNFALPSRSHQLATSGVHCALQSSPPTVNAEPRLLRYLEEAKRARHVAHIHAHTRTHAGHVCRGPSLGRTAVIGVPLLDRQRFFLLRKTNWNSSWRRYCKEVCDRWHLQPRSMRGWHDAQRCLTLAPSWKCLLKWPESREWPSSGQEASTRPFSQLERRALMSAICAQFFSHTRTHTKHKHWPTGCVTRYQTGGVNFRLSCLLGW